MDHYSFWSLFPPLLAIILAIKTRQVFVSLLFGIWLGWVILSGGNLLNGSTATIQALVDVFKDPGNTRTIMFSSLVGALIAFIQRSGGVEGFVNRIYKILEKIEKKKSGRSRVIVQLIAWLTGTLIFVESSINALTVGSVFRPIFDKLKIPREKLAYIADSISAPTCILIPLNAWGAYIMGLIAAQGFDNPFEILVGAFPFNFYPMLAMAMVVGVIVTQKDFGPMKKAELRAKNEGKVIRDGATPLISSDVVSMEKKEGVKARARNMIIPIGVMVGMMPLMLVFTGWDQVENISQLHWYQQILSAIGKGSGSTSVLYSVLTSIFVGSALYMSQKIFSFQETIDLIFKGVGGLIPLALLMMLAFAIGNVCRSLGTGVYVAELSKEWLSPNFVPVIVYIVASFIAFSTGTSWGTFAIMIAIGVPMAQALDANLYLTIAAALGGGVFGDHCSPISDTTIISSMASASDHIDHVKTQLPYALTAGGVTVVLYLILGYVMH
ncbi:MAG: sodium:solute symporter [Ignavibacteriae bacterium HGW-Ignavibacteriae-2]|jgi:Na+/H+ antiporter NhaC|nr:sodium:solute symporter [Bacteroidota bacterium]PKL88486.1 MAG: sodium:solute symporter [Ignavibacteriae bacterium HGW-Ignavibacteriae-2]